MWGNLSLFNGNLYGNLYFYFAPLHFPKIKAILFLLYIKGVFFISKNSIAA